MKSSLFHRRGFPLPYLAFMLLGCGEAALKTVTVAAATIPGLFNTGVNNTNGLLSSSAPDTHYRIVSSADPIAQASSARTVVESSVPKSWLTNGPLSKWIAPTASQTVGNVPGEYRYRFSFNLGLLDPRTVRIGGQWAADDQGVQILANGIATGSIAPASPNSWTPFQIASSQGAIFAVGSNALDFVVLNAGTSPNPTGIRIELSGTADSAPPEGVPPILLVQPEDQSVQVGLGAQFRVIASGTPPLQYQWFAEGLPLADGTNATLILPTVAPDAKRSYQVRVSNGAGEVTSRTVQLNLLALSPSLQSYEPPGPSSRRTGIAITEIQYHPAKNPQGRNLEFIELYNSNPFAEDIGGYRIRGDWSYDIPTGTTLGPSNRLVIAAAPEDIRNQYGIENVLGGFTGRLPDDRGKVRLLSKAGAVLLEVEYQDRDPWPVAADGTGHSLVLVRPSYGENNPRAWAHSGFVGGSPGTEDPMPGGPLENLVINEVYSNPNDRSQAFIELHNHSPFPVNLSGCWISDETSTNEHRFPDGATLQPQGHLAITDAELGFALHRSGGTLQLWNAQATRVIEAIRYGGQDVGYSWGRYPNGTGRWRELSAPSAGLANAEPLPRGVVINEIHYHPLSAGNAAEFIELHNFNAHPMPLDGWILSDAVSFQFPTGSLLPAGGYLVVAKDPGYMLSAYTNLSARQVFGPYTGTLSDRSERILLAMPAFEVMDSPSGAAMTNRYYVQVNEVTYQSGGAWPSRADGDGSTLELIDPRSDNSVGSNWGASDESNKAPWTTLENSGLLDLGVGACDSLQVFLQGRGEALIDDVEVITGTGTNRITNSGFESTPTGWVFQGTHSRSSWETNAGYNSARSLHLRASGRGDYGANRIRRNISPPLRSGTNATIRAKVRWLSGHPEILFRFRGAYLEASGRLETPSQVGTPGQPNSRRVINSGPVIDEVSHRPILPAAGERVSVFAHVEDPDGVSEVLLHYRVDPGTNTTSIPMNDSGKDGDVVAGDGVWTAQIPAQANRALVAFRIVATDRGQSASLFPTDAPRRECLIRFGDGSYSNGFGTYRLWYTSATRNAWSNREKLSNDPLDATFVYGHFRSVYNIGALYSGSAYTSPGYDSPDGTLCGYNFVFPEDQLLLGARDFTLDFPIRDVTAQREPLMYWFMEQLGLPYNYRRYVNVFVNGTGHRSRSGFGIQGLIYEDVQQPSSDGISEWWPDDTEGSLFKGDYWHEFDDTGNRIDPATANSLEHFTTTGGVRKIARYRWNWRPRAIQDSANDYQPLFDLIDAANSPTPAYASSMESVVDVDNWARTFVGADLAANWDSFGNGGAKNTFHYKPTQGRWSCMSWDFDVGLGVFNDPPDSALFTAGDAAVSRFQTFPAFARIYWAALQEAVDGFFQNSVIDPRVMERHATLQSSGVTSPKDPSGTGTPLTTWITQRRAYLISQLKSKDAPFTITTRDGNDFATSDSWLTLSGTAPVRVRQIQFNGSTYPVVWTTLTNWSAVFNLNAGTNRIEVGALDAHGTLLSNLTDSIVVRYTRSNPSPVGQIVINEILRSPAVPGAGFIELHNRSETASYDLGGWKLDGVGFEFPAGSRIATNGFLLVVNQREIFSRVHGWNFTNIAGVYPGTLRAGGETLALIQPGSNGGIGETLDEVTFDAGYPWPADHLVGGSLELRDPARDNNRVGNWRGATNRPGVRPFTPGAVNQSRSTLPEFPWIWLNEIQPAPGALTDNRGDSEPWVELYNSGPTPFALDSLQLEIPRPDGSVHRWRFPSDGSILPQQRVLIWLDGEPGESTREHLHADFRPDSTSGTVVLIWDGTEEPITLDYLRYPALKIGSSFGKYPDGAVASPREFQTPTPATANSISNSITRLRINEWMAGNTSTIPDPADGAFDDWFELYNGESFPIDLAHYYLSDSAQNPRKHEIPPGTVIPALGYLLVWADEQSGQTQPGKDLHVNFKLSSAGESLLLSAPDGTLLDRVDFGKQSDNVSEGRYPDGNPDRGVSMSPSTPGSANATGGLSHPPIQLVAVREQIGPTTLTWNSVAGRHYQLQRTASLNNSVWESVPGADNLAAAGSVTTFVDGDEPSPGARFYRIQLLP